MGHCRVGGTLTFFPLRQNVIEPRVNTMLSGDAILLLKRPVTALECVASARLNCKAPAIRYHI